MSSLEELEALISSAGLTDFVPTAASYCSSDSAANLLPLTDIQAPLGRTAIDAERAKAILSAVRQDNELPPITVTQPAGLAPSFRLHDGFHRYHLSAALGFTHVPVQRHWDDL